MKAALLQMTAGIDPDGNAATLVEAVADAARAGAAILFTPEMSNLIDRDRARAALSITGQDQDATLRAVRAAAAEHRIWVHLGSLAIRRADGRFANRAFVIDAQGSVRATYDKLHMFDVELANGETWRESAAYVAGDGATVVDTPVGPVGLSICYDLRFADLYRALSDAGARILAVPAAFTVPTGSAHWHVLLRARAIEAGAFVIAAAQTGRHADGRTTFGHSLVIDPWGSVILDLGDQPGLGLVDIDLSQVDEVRARIPAIVHRRPIPPVAVVQ